MICKPVDGAFELHITPQHAVLPQSSVMLFCFRLHAFVVEFTPRLCRTSPELIWRLEPNAVPYLPLRRVVSALQRHFQLTSLPAGLS